MIAIIKYNSGNITSIQNALEKLGQASIVTDNENDIINSKKVILPGVGEARSAMDYLTHKGLDKVIRALKQPILGICLGMHLMCKHSEERNTNCLGVFDINVRKFPATRPVPHMGWNNLSSASGILFDGVDSSSDMYYAHSYYAETNAQTTATCHYIVPFTAAIQQDNFYGTQFHPE